MYPNIPPREVSLKVQSQSLDLAPRGECGEVVVSERLQKFRTEVEEMIGDDQRSEFERLFPAWHRKSTAGSFRDGFDPLEASAATSEARALLGQLEGWLGGFVVEVKMNLEAEAYAKERLKQERGIGFKPA
jgi:hypothetical protein